MNKFRTIEKLDTAILYALNFLEHQRIAISLWPHSVTGGHAAIQIIPSLSPLAILYGNAFQASTCTLLLERICEVARTRWRLFITLEALC